MGLNACLPKLIYTCRLHITFGLSSRLEEERLHEGTPSSTIITPLPYDHARRRRLLKNRLVSPLAFDEPARHDLLPCRRILLLIFIGTLTLNLTLLPEQVYASKCGGDIAHWKAESRNPDTYNVKIAAFFISLAKRGCLPIQSVLDTDGKPVSQLLSDRRLLYGPYYPQDLDLLMCKLNSSVCTFEQLPPSGSKRISLERAVWKNKAGDTLMLPAIEFVPGISPQPYDKKRGQRIENIVIKDRLGCPQFDDDCKRLVVDNLNRGNVDILDPHFAGTIMVPTLSLTARVSTNALAARKKLDVKSQFIKPEKLFNASIPAPIAVAPQSGGSQADFVRSRDCLFTWINRPQQISTAIANILYVPTVVVLDGWVDKLQCAFDCPLPSRSQLLVENVTTSILPGGSAISASAPTPTATPSPLACCAFEADPDPAEHGTHVVGLIAARGLKSTPPGINPDANVETFQVSGNGLNIANRDNGNRITDDIDTAAKGSLAPDLFNMSIQYSVDLSHNRTDWVEKYVKKYTAQYLFVVAAGNYHHQYKVTDICDERPGCLKSPNALSVVALQTTSADSNTCRNSNEPTVWQAKTPTGDIVGSNFGIYFDIGAPGDSIMSTISANRYGPLSGTSQAAAIVSGAASLLFEKCRRLTPYQVRARMIYSSDFYHSLLTNSFGGMLNVGRALNFDHDIVTLTSGEQISGTVDPLYNITYAPFALGYSKPIQMNQVLRLSYDPKTSSYVMFLPTIVNGRPERLLDVKIQPTNKDDKGKGEKLGITTVDGEKKSYDLTEISDYTAAIPGQETVCGGGGDDTTGNN